MNVQPRELRPDTYRVRRLKGGYVVSPSASYEILHGPTSTREMCERWIEKRQAKAELVERKCMNCRRPFLSWGIGNRLCDKCR